MLAQDEGLLQSQRLDAISWPYVNLFLPPYEMILTTLIYNYDQNESISESIYMIFIWY